MTEANSRIAVFGGTFDPPHAGHLALARSALGSGLIDEVLFIPAASPPHKLDAVISPFETRLRMLELALAGEPNCAISTMEGDRLPKPSYTVETMRELSRANPDNKYLLLVGEDSLAQLQTWFRAEELIENYDFLIYPRRDWSIDWRGFGDYWGETIADKMRGSIIGAPEVVVSSTELREKIHSGLDIPEKLLPAAVGRYIDAEGMYR